MLTFKYKARDKEGHQVSGVEYAANRNSVAERLRAKNLFPISIEQTKKQGKKTSTKFIKLKDLELIFFTRQISDLIDSGISLIRALELLVNQTGNPRIREVSQRVYAYLNEGGYLWEVLSEYPQIFNPIYIGMIKAAELGGNLEAVFKKLADFIEQKRATKDTLISMLTYPLVVLGVGLLAVFFLMSFVIPRMMFVFSDNETALPLITKILIAVSLFLSKFWWLVFVLTGVIIFALKKASDRDDNRRKIDEIIYKLPVVGGILGRIIFARFSYIMSLMLSQGLSILECLDISRGVVQNRMISEKLKNLRNNMAQGTDFSQCLQQGKIFPQVMVDMVSVGEQTGRLEQILLKISQKFDQQVKQDIKRMLSILEPAIILFIALIVGSLVAAILLPVFELNFQAM